MSGATSDQQGRHASAGEPGAAPPLPLFRPEVAATGAQQWLGTIRLARPLSAWAVALFALVISGALVAFIAFGSFARKAQVSGIVTPSGGSVTISSLSPGVIVRSAVAEGSQVRRGQTLFELSSEHHGSGGELSALLTQQLTIRQQALAAERRARIAQDADKRRELDARLANLDAEQAKLAEELALARRRQDLAQSTVTKYETLQGSGYVSAAQVQQKLEEALDLRARSGTLERGMVQLSANRIGVLAQRNELNGNLAAALAQLDQASASLQQEAAENQGRRTVLIKAPQDGVLTTITNQAGQFVTAGQVLATLIPAGDASAPGRAELEAHLYASNSTIGFIAVGQAVNIRYRAFPYQKFGLYQGRIVDISRTPLAPNELPANIAGTILRYAQGGAQGSTAGEGLYRVKVRLARQSVTVYGRPQPLQAGMTLEADLLLDRRRIWEWVLEPVLALAIR